MRRQVSTNLRTRSSFDCARCASSRSRSPSSRAAEHAQCPSRTCETARRPPARLDVKTAPDQGPGKISVEILFPPHAREARGDG